MKSIHYIKNVDDLRRISNNKNHVITIGVFDGVHKGHQSLIDNLKKILPIDGIYASKVIINKKEYIGALSIGNNPTFGHNNNKSVEVHLIDFKDDIYDEFINIKIYKHIRDQIKYNDIATLMIQMQKDLINIKEYFKNEKNNK